MSHYPSRITLVLDACFSQKAIKSITMETNLEILCSSSEGQKSFECDLDEKYLDDNMSHFSSSFCNALNTLAFDEITVDNLKVAINKKLEKIFEEYNLRETQTCYLGSNGSDKGMVVGYNKEVNELTNFLKEKYTVKALKESLLTFYPRRGSNHNKIRHADSFTELFSILFNEKKYLRCILKQLDFESSLLSEYETVECEALREKASQENKIDKLIIKVDEDTEKNLVSATISGYYGYSSGAYSPTKTLTGLDLSSEKSLVEIPKYIEEVLIGKKARTIELQLILPDVLLPLNYQTEAMNKRFDILKRLVRRLNNHHLINIEDEIDYWEENSQLIDEMQKNKVLNHIDDTGYVAQYNKHENNIAMLYNESLSSQIKEIYDWGVPILFYPHTAYEMTERLNLNDCVVAEVKNKMSQFMSGEFLKNNATHFIYDDYYDVDFLPNTDI